MTRDEIINYLVPVLQQYPIKRAALFGSYARGDHTDTSDVDLVVDFVDDVLLFDNFYNLYDALEKRLCCKIDLLRYGTIIRDMKPIIKEKILNDLRWFYET